MCMYGDDDYWEFYTEHTPKARTEQTCVECGRIIEKGERYHTQGGKNDGQFIWHKTCAHCTAASEWLNTVCDGWIFTRRQEDFTEHVTGHEKYVRSRPLVRLLRWMQADWRDRNGTLRPVEHVQVLTGIAIAAYIRQRDAERVAA